MLRMTLEKLKNLDLGARIHHEKIVGGLVITEEKIMLMYLAGGQRVFREEAALPAGTIEGGALRKKENLVAALETLRRRKELPSTSIVLSLPAVVAQPFIFELFPNLRHEEVSGAISLAADSSLPLPRKEIYVDWEEWKGERPVELSRRRILFLMGVRALIDPYLEALVKAGFAVVAAEVHPQSFLRSSNVADRPMLAIYINRDTTTLAAYAGGNFVFQFNIPKNIPPNKDGNPAAASPAAALTAERILRFLRSDEVYQLEIRKIFVLGDKEERRAFLGAMPEDLKKITAEVEDLEARLAEGCAQRGLIPRREDTMMSLLAVTTATAYERERLISFLSSAKKVSFAFFGFFTLFFLGILILVGIASRATVQTLAQEQITLPPGLAEAKNSARSFNEHVERLYGILRQSPRWGYTLGETERILNPSLAVERLEIASDGSVVLGGIARHREGLLELKNTLSDHAIFAPITLPLNALIAKGNISFSLEIKIKDSAVFYQ